MNSSIGFNFWTGSKVKPSALIWSQEEYPVSLILILNQEVLKSIDNIYWALISNHIHLQVVLLELLIMQHILVFISDDKCWAFLCKGFALLKNCHPPFV